MTAYLLYMASPAILYVLVEACAGKSITKNVRAKKIYLFWAGLCMTFMIGLRAPTNGSRDTLYYFRLWEHFSGLSVTEFINTFSTIDMEAGYKLVTFVLSKIFPNGQWLLFLSGLFMSISICSFIYKNCDNPVLALLVFNCLGLFGFMVQGLRQALAMSICLWALEVCKQRKFFKFLLFVVLASTFHASAVVFIPVYFICFKEFNRRTVGFFALALGVAIICLPALINLVNLAIKDSYSSSDGSNRGGIVAILIYVVILVFALMSRGNRQKNFPLFVCMAVAGLACMILRRTTNGIIERVSFYYAFSQMVLVSNSAGRIANNDRINVILYHVLIFALCFCVSIYKASYSVLIPYLFCWQY